MPRKRDENVPSKREEAPVNAPEQDVEDELRSYELLLH